MTTLYEWRALSKQGKSALVRANWERGMSMSELAAKIGRQIGRNAVIGVYTRDKQLKIDCPPNLHMSVIKAAENRTVKPMRVPSIKPKRASALRPASYFLPTPEQTPPPVSLMLPLQDLERNSCKWPIGDPKHTDFGFCGAPRYNGGPYCPHHARMSFAPAEKRRAAK